MPNANRFCQKFPYSIRRMFFAFAFLLFSRVRTSLLKFLFLAKPRALPHYRKTALPWHRCGPEAVQLHLHKQPTSRRGWLNYTIRGPQWGMR